MGEGTRDWSLVIFGIILVVCGLALGLMPGFTLVTIAIFVGILLLVAGIGSGIFYFRMRESRASGWYLAYAILDVVIGVMILAHLALSAAVVPWLVGVCFIALGVFQIASAVAVRKLGAGVWVWPVLSGVINVVFGSLFFAMPQLLAIWMAVVVVFRGITMVINGVLAGR